MFSQLKKAIDQMERYEFYLYGTATMPPFQNNF